MRGNEKYFAVYRQLMRDETIARNQLLFRQEAEYEGRGIQPGDDPEIDEKFDKQVDALNEKFQDRLGSLRAHAKDQKLDDFIQYDMGQTDPYDVNKMDDGTPRPLEPNVESDYISAFNLGYRLNKSDPKLAKTISEKTKGDAPQMAGLKDGITEHEKEIVKERETPKDIHPDIWKELNESGNDITGDDSRDREPPKDIEE